MNVERICGSIPTSASSTLLAEDTDMGDDDYDMEGMEGRSLFCTHTSVDIMNFDLNAFFCCLSQVMLMMRLRRSFHSTYSLEQAPVLEPHLSPHPAVVLVHPPLMENLRPPAGRVVDIPPDPRKVNADDA